MISVTGLCSFSFGALWQFLHMYTCLQQTQQKSNAIIIISEGCWLFVMRGNMTCPQTMGCWFLHEANPAFDRQLPFCRFRKSFNFDEDHSSSSPVCTGRKYSCVFAELLVSYRIAFCPPGTNDDMLTWHSEHSVAWWHGGTTQQKNLEIPIKANSRAAPPLTIN